jgi:hypothetical protein
MLRQVDARAQAQEVVEPPHPLGIAAGQVVVDRHHVHALAGQGIEVHRQRGHQGLALAGAHLGDLAGVQAMPPISCTSKWRIFKTRLPASRTVAKASGSRSSRVSPLASAP